MNAAEDDPTTTSHPADYHGLKAGPFMAPEAVDLSAIRRFCELVEDDNPLYHDEVVAKESRWGELVAPPGSLMTWCIPPLWAPFTTKTAEPVEHVYNSDLVPGDRVVVRGVRTTYSDAIRLHDRLVQTERLTKVTAKTTRLGAGNFLDVEQEFTRADGTHVATQITTCFKY